MNNVIQEESFTNNSKKINNYSLFRRLETKDNSKVKFSKRIFSGEIKLRKSIFNIRKITLIIKRMMIITSILLQIKTDTKCFGIPRTKIRVN